MLVLTRKQNEKIVLEYGGVKISIVLLFTTPKRCRLGIEAPPEVTIYRSELEGFQRQPTT